MNVHDKTATRMIAQGVKISEISKHLVQPVLCTVNVKRVQIFTTFFGSAFDDVIPFWVGDLRSMISGHTTSGTHTPNRKRQNAKQNCHQLKNSM